MERRQRFHTAVSLSHTQREQKIQRAATISQMRGVANADPTCVRPSQDKPDGQKMLTEKFLTSRHDFHQFSQPCLTKRSNTSSAIFTENIFFNITAQRPPQTLNYSPRIDPTPHTPSSSSTSKNFKNQTQVLGALREKLPFPHATLWY